MRGTGLGSNGPENVPASGSQNQQIAERILLANDAVATSLVWYGNYIDKSIPPQSTKFVIRIYDEANKLPNAIIDQQIVAAASANTGFSDGLSRPIYLFSAQLAQVSFSGRSPIWISILEDDVATPIAWGWQGELPPAPPLDKGRYAARFGDSEVWYTGSLPSYHRAFTIYGIVVPEASALTCSYWLVCGVLIFSLRGGKLHK